MDDEPKTPRRTLTDDEISTRRIGRRTVLLGAVGGGVAVAGITGGTAARAASDSDSGSNADPAGRGVSNLTDNDDGSWADAPGRGRGSGGYNTGITDADNGSVYDQPGQGRGGTY